MKVIELLKMGSEMLKALSKSEVRRDDWRYVGMYDEFVRMRDLGVNIPRP